MHQPREDRQTLSLVYICRRIYIILEDVSNKYFVIKISVFILRNAFSKLLDKGFDMCNDCRFERIKSLIYILIITLKHDCCQDSEFIMNT